MKKLLIVLTAMISFSVANSQIELIQNELKGFEPTQAALDYAVYGDIKEVTTLEYSNLFGEVELSTKTILNFNSEGYKTQEETGYYGFGMDMNFVVKFYYDRDWNLTELNYVDEFNHSQIDQVIRFKYNSDGQMIEKIDTYDGQTKHSYYAYDVLDIKQIKEYDYDGNLVSTIDIQCEYLLGDIEKKIETYHADNSVTTTLYESDYILGVTKATETSSYGTTTTEFIYDDLSFLVKEKKSYGNSTFYSYDYDSENWVSLLCSDNLGSTTSYFKREIKYFDGRVTGDISSAAPAGSTNISNSSNTGTPTPGGTNTPGLQSSNCSYGNCTNGYGEWNKDGDYYDGFFKHGEYNGPGALTYEDGQSTVAQFTNGVKNGFGIYNWNDQQSYIGYFSNDQLDGYGIYIDGDETVVAIFDEGNYSQTFSFEFTDNYTGCLRGDCDDGFGIYQFDNGDVYTGYFTNSKMDMFGYYEFSSGGSYLGEWGMGDKHGFGYYQWDAESSYLGNWNHDQLHGTGVYYYSEAGESKEMSGTFKNGEHYSDEAE